jgi:thiamine-phosphate pyrophosphorylase
VFQIALISSPENFAGEHEILEQMFECGLQTLYTRKPLLPESLLERWIIGINIKWHNNILPWPGSAHSFDELQKIGEDAKVCFLSPVFDSISKLGYKSKFSKQELKEGIAAWKNFHHSQKLFALGGVEADNIAELAELGFDGAAVLGNVWHSSDPVEALSLAIKRGLAL